MFPIKNRNSFTIEEYHQMAEADILPKSGIELIHGEVIEMSPIGSKHAATVEKCKDVLFVSLDRRKALIRVQNPLPINNHSETEPDLARVAYQEDNYALKLPEAQDTFLIIEVADSSIEFDKAVKLPLYASAGIPHVWIIDLDSERIEQYSQPGNESYLQKVLVDKEMYLELPSLDLSMPAKDIMV